MKTVAVFGIGLIGGSFALALRKAGFSGKILGVSSESTLKRALDLGIIDAAATLESAAGQADLIYLAQPIRVILETLSALDAWVQPEALITDAGSTKKVVVQHAAAVLKRAQFLGGHPLAGKESRGLDSADADLFLRRTYVLAPTGATDLETSAARQFRDWLTRMGAVLLTIDAAAHDQMLAYTSHVPQIASTALAMLLADRDYVSNQIFGPALVDSTRLALSSYDIWADILATNANYIDGALAGYIQCLEALRRDLNKPAMADHFRCAAEIARRVRER